MPARAHGWQRVNRPLWYNLWLNEANVTNQLRCYFVWPLQVCGEERMISSWNTWHECEFLMSHIRPPVSAMYVPESTCGIHWIGRGGRCRGWPKKLFNLLEWIVNSKWVSINILNRKPFVAMATVRPHTRSQYFPFNCALKSRLFPNAWFDIKRLAC